MAKHVYEVQLSNGAAYDVKTDHYHEDYPHQTFMDHLVDILKSIVAGVATHHITNTRYKGRT